MLSVLEYLRMVQFYLSPEGSACWSVQEEEGQVCELSSLGEKSRATASLRA